MASASLPTFQKPLAASGFTVRLQPVPIGSISTRSVKRSQVSGLSRSLACAKSRASGPRSSRRGPTRPRLRKAEAAPGPPLNTKVSGRFADAVLGDIGGVEHRGGLVAGLAEEGERAGGGGIGELALRGVDGVLGDGVGRQQPQDALAGGLMLGLLVVLAVPLLHARGGAARRRGRARRRRAPARRQRQETRSFHGSPLWCDARGRPSRAQRSRRTSPRQCGVYGAECEGDEQGAAPNPIWPKPSAGRRAAETDWVAILASALGMGVPILLGAASGRLALGLGVAVGSLLVGGTPARSQLARARCGADRLAGGGGCRGRARDAAIAGHGWVSDAIVVVLAGAAGAVAAMGRPVTPMAIRFILLLIITVAVAENMPDRAGLLAADRGRRAMDVAVEPCARRAGARGRRCDGAGGDARRPCRCASA